MMGSLIWWPVFAFSGFIGILIGALLFVFWIWIIVDCAQRKFKNSDEKIVWIIIVVLAGWIGGLIYYFVVKNNNPRGISKR
jgi:predicted PurR-regulated permease PerM